MLPRLALLALAAALLLAIPALRANPPRMPEEIVVGAVYNVFHEQFETDEAFFARVDRDFGKMKDAHFNAVMVFPLSQWDPETRELLWPRSDYMVRKAEELELGLVPLLFKEEQGRHYLPIWKFQEISGLWEAHETGQPNSRENVDHQIPEVRALIDDYFEAVIGRYGKSPAMLFYNVWNEPHYVSSSAATIERFRAWLKAKYGEKLSGISRAWGEDYTSWDQVTPLLNDNWDSSLPLIDWQIFTYELNGMALRSFAETARRLDPIHPTNANPVGSVWTNPDTGRYTVDNWPLAEAVDIHGISYYPGIWERAHGGRPIPFYRHSFLFNHVRSAAGEKPWMLTELQTNGQNGLALNGFFGYDDLHLLSWTALANAGKGVLYWKWSPFMRGRQSFGRGLTRPDGELAPRGEAVRDFAAVLEKHGRLLRDARPEPAQAAVLLDMRGLFKSLEPGAEKSPANFMRESYEGLFRALWEENIALDVLRMDRPLALDDLQKYKVAFLPFQILTPEPVARLLREYVSGGGMLVADARTATIDALDFGYEINPGGGLDEVFGVRRRDWVGDRFARPEIRLGDDALWGGAANASFDGIYFRETWRVGDGVEILARFADTEEPAIARNRFGKGSAILAAAPLGGSFFRDADSGPANVLSALARSAGALPAAAWRAASEEDRAPAISVHRAGETRVAYLINHYDTPLVGSVGIPELSKASKVTVLTEGSAALVERGGAIDLDIEIPARRALVIVLE